MRAHRVAVAAVFFLNGAGFASWAVRLPALQEQHALGEGALGAALLGAAAGLFVSLTAASVVVARYGSRRTTIAAGLAYAAALPLLALAPSFPALVAALVVVGFTNGSLDLAMNAQAVEVERRYQRSIMSSFHGLFSAGGLVGAAAAGLLAGLDVGLRPHLVGTGLLVASVLLAVASQLPHDPDGAHSRDAGKPVLVLPRGPLLGLGAVAFGVLMAEGAINDWSAVYLRSEVDAGSGTATLGFAAFAGAMTAGRLSGDRLVTLLGRTDVVRLGGLLASLGLAAALLAPGPTVAVAGFGLVGLGLAPIFPLVLAAAGRTPGVRPASGLAAASTAGYTGFLVGPALIGFLAEVTSLRVGLGIVLACTALPALSGRRVRLEQGWPEAQCAPAGAPS
jgi:MFS family permease